MLTLIADCGSTKVQWILLDDESGDIYADFTTTGFNAVLTPPGEIAATLASEVAPKLAPYNIYSLRFYGAGCIGGDTDRRLQQLLRDNIPHDRCEISSDLVGAARALLGNSEGIACILGTGSNTGLWDGHSIVANTPPLGFILGDEGSGAALGARFVSDVYKGLMAEEIVAEFDRVYGLSKADIIENVYRRPAANRFLASFCPFLSAHLDHPDIAALVIGEFTRFISRNLMQYNPLNEEGTPLPLGFVGSVAHYFSAALTLCCTRMGFDAPRIVRVPMEGLVAYHTAGA